MPAPTLRNLDPALVQPVYDALLALMGTDYVGSNANMSFDGAGTNFGISVTDAIGDRWNAQWYMSNVRVAITPSGVALDAAETQQFQATATNKDGTPVAGAVFVWSLIGSALGSISATGLYTAPAVVVADAVDTIRCSVQGEPSWAQTSVQLRGA
jgi:hypothetical protein